MQDIKLTLILIFWTFVVPVIITIVVEEICLLFLKEKNKKIFLACFIMNIFLNPILNHSLILFTSLKYYFGYYETLIVLEIFVIATEALIYMFLTKDIKKGIYYSVVLNISSLALSLAFVFAI